MQALDAWERKGERVSFRGHSIFAVDSGAAAGAERRAHRDRWVGALEALDAPLTVVIGMDDPISGAHVAAGCREVFPQAIVVDLPGVGHYPQLEAPDEVRAALPWNVAPWQSPPTP